MHFLSILLFFSLLFSLSTPTDSLTIDLIHRDSPLSPFYNSSATPSELLQNAAFRSISRSQRHDHFGSNIISNITVGDYLMRISVGTPPVETWASVDTGSDLVWLQCLPCKKCYHQNAPFFNPKMSSTYKMVPCRSKPCAWLPQEWAHCGVSKQCLYVYEYADNSGSSGELAQDFFHFGGQGVSFHKTVFGCGHESWGEFSSEGAGLVGLGNGPLSLVSQLGPQKGHRFSYCLVPYLSNCTGKLKLGEEANISGSYGVASSPMITTTETSSGYILNLKGITIGQKTVKIGGDSKGGNIEIDSGSTLTHLPKAYYEKVEALVREAIGMKPVKKPPEPYSLCYADHEFGSYIKEKFPSFVVHFRGADLSLKPDQNLFVQNVLYHIPNLFCFAIVPIDGSIAVYGNVAQINFQVEFDLKAQTVSFAPSDCAK